jgi:hypothetical protein
MHVFQGLADAEYIPTLYSLTRRAALAYIRDYHNEGMYPDLSSPTASSVYSQDNFYYTSESSSLEIVWSTIYWDPPELITDNQRGSSVSSVGSISPRTMTSMGNTAARETALPDLREYMRTHTRFSSAGNE